MIEWVYRATASEIHIQGNYAYALSSKIVEMINEVGKSLSSDGYSVDVEPIQILVSPLRDTILLTVVSRGRSMILKPKA